MHLQRFLWFSGVLETGGEESKLKILRRVSDRLLLTKPERPVKVLACGTVRTCNETLQSCI